MSTPFHLYRSPRPFGMDYVILKDDQGWYYGPALTNDAETVWVPHDRRPSNWHDTCAEAVAAAERDGRDPIAGRTATSTLADAHSLRAMGLKALDRALDENALFEEFRERVRTNALDALDSLMADMGIPTDEDGPVKRRETLLGARDEDLHHLFAALDEQAKRLWARGARETILNAKREELAR